MSRRGQEAVGRVGRWVAGAALLGLLGAWAATPAPAGPAAEGQAIRVEATEFAYDAEGPVKVIRPRPGRVTFTVKAGRLLFRVHNAGLIEHNFVIWDQQERTVGEIAVLAPGETQDLEVQLPRGLYQIVCTFPGHRALGMEAALEVQ